MSIRVEVVITNNNCYIMTTEAFDPFANDEDIDDDNVFQLNTTMKISNRNHRNSNPTRRTSPPTQTSQSINGNGVNHITDEVMKEFNYAFPSMSLNGNDDDGDDHAFGFTSHFFPKEYTSTTTTAATTADVNTNNISSPAATTTPLTLVIAEEMSVIHKSSSNQCSVTVRGIISVSRVQQYSCHMSHVPSLFAVTSTFLLPTQSWRVAQLQTTVVTSPSVILIDNY